jgi:hypothetical protein
MLRLSGSYAGAARVSGGSRRGPEGLAGRRAFASDTSDAGDPHGLRTPRSPPSARMGSHGLASFVVDQIAGYS